MIPILTNFSFLFPFNIIQNYAKKVGYLNHDLSSTFEEELYLFSFSTLSLFEQIIPLASHVKTKSNIKQQNTYIFTTLIKHTYNKQYTHFTTQNHHFTLAFFVLGT